MVDDVRRAAQEIQSASRRMLREVETSRKLIEELQTNLKADMVAVRERNRQTLIRAALILFASSSIPLAIDIAIRLVWR